MTGVAWSWSTNETAEPISAERFEELVQQFHEQIESTRSGERAVFADWCAAWTR